MGSSVLLVLGVSLLIFPAGLVSALGIPAAPSSGSLDSHRPAPSIVRRGSMLHNSVPAAVAVLVSVLVPAHAQAQDLPLPTEWSTHYAWFLESNPAYEPQADSAESALTAAHIQYQLRLQRDGHAIAAGGLAPREGDPVIGLTILRAATLADAQAMAEADPAVRAGRILARVREWWVPTAQLK